MVEYMAYKGSKYSCVQTALGVLQCKANSANPATQECHIVRESAGPRRTKVGDINVYTWGCT